MKHLFSRFALCLLTALVLSACGSSVSLKPPPVVEDRAPSATSAPRTPWGPAKSAVAAVKADRDEGMAVSATDGPPANVPRLIYFDFDSFFIKTEFQNVVAAHAKYLSANPNHKMAVEGHTDERGGHEYNLALGQRRAEAVRSALELAGARADQVEAVSFGKEKPAVLGSSEEAYAQNRRAELSYR